MRSDLLIVGRALDVFYDGRAIFRALDCAFTAGVHALRGPNGTGKSTLLRVLAGAQPADAGQIWLDGIDLLRRPMEARQRSSYVPDESPVYPFMTGEELLDFVARVKRTRIDAGVESLIHAFGLDRHLRVRFDAMSLGTRKKMMLCAASIGEPRVLLLDEPSNGLDDAARRHFAGVLRVWGRDSAILFATHDEDFVAASEASVIEMQSLPRASHGAG